MSALTTAEQQPPPTLTSPTPHSGAAAKRGRNPPQAGAVRRNSKAVGARGTARKGGVPHEDGPLCRPE